MPDAGEDWLKFVEVVDMIAAVSETSRLNVVLLPSEVTWEVLEKSSSPFETKENKDETIFVEVPVMPFGVDSSGNGELELEKWSISIDSEL